MKERWRVFVNGIFGENPIFRLVLGMCPTLATSTAVANAFGMGLAATFVLVCSNVIISLLRKVIPDQVRIPCYIVVVATFVTIVDKVMAASAPGLHQVLGIFIPLIVVNCIILGRAEAFAKTPSAVPHGRAGHGAGIYPVSFSAPSGNRYEGTFWLPSFGFPAGGLSPKTTKLNVHLTTRRLYYFGSGPGGH